MNLQDYDIFDLQLALPGGWEPGDCDEGELEYNNYVEFLENLKVRASRSPRRIYSLQQQQQLSLSLSLSVCLSLSLSLISFAYARVNG